MNASKWEGGNMLSVLFLSRDSIDIQLRNIFLALTIVSCVDTYCSVSHHWLVIITEYNRRIIIVMTKW